MSGKNQEKVIETLRMYGPRSYSQLEARSGVPKGSLGRVLGALKRSGQIEHVEGKWQLPRQGLTFLNIAQTDSSAGGNDSPTRSRDTSADSSDSARDTPHTVEEPQEPKSRTERRDFGDSGGLRAWTPEGMISLEEHRKRKGYTD